MDSKVGCTVTSLEVENSIFSSARRSIPPSAMIADFQLDVGRMKDMGDRRYSARAESGARGGGDEFGESENEG